MPFLHIPLPVFNEFSQNVLSGEEFHERNIVGMEGAVGSDVDR
jgi:hypothetical protein